MLSAFLYLPLSSPSLPLYPLLSLSLSLPLSPSLSLSLSLSNSLSLSFSLLLSLFLFLFLLPIYSSLVSVSPQSTAICYKCTPINEFIHARHTKQCGLLEKIRELWKMYAPPPPPPSSGDLQSQVTFKETSRSFRVTFLTPCITLSTCRRVDRLIPVK